MSFSGFPKETFTFLRGLTRNNNKAWFDNHRDDYENFYMTPAKEFVVAIGERLQRFEPTITADPRIPEGVEYGIGGIEAVLSAHEEPAIDALFSIHQRL